jgi:hypothetical protein
MTLASKVIIFSIKIMDQFMIWINPDQNYCKPTVCVLCSIAKEVVHHHALLIFNMTT